MVFRELQGVAHGAQARPRAHGDLDGVADRQLRAGFHAAEPRAASYGVHLRRGAVVVSRKRRAALRRSAVPLAAPLRAPPHPEGGRR